MLPYEIEEKIGDIPLAKQADPHFKVRVFLVFLFYNVLNSAKSMHFVKNGKYVVKNAK